MVRSDNTGGIIPVDGANIGTLFPAPIKCPTMSVANANWEQYGAKLSPRFKSVYDLALTRLKTGEHWLHGPSHWLKVASNAAMLAGQTKGADATVAQLFGLLHDCERMNDDHDPEHGIRAAAYAKMLFTQGKLPIDESQLRLLLVACERHDLGEVSDDPTIGVCWDADRLDLPRVGIKPDPKLLSTQAAKNASMAR